MIVLYSHLYKKLGHDAPKGLTPITTVCTTPFGRNYPLLNIFDHAFNFAAGRIAWLK